jgi:hypothetical protein
MSGILDLLPPRERHDLRGALRTLGYAVEAIRAGERFDGVDGAEQIESLAAAVRRIEEILQAELRQGPPPP